MENRKHFAAAAVAFVIWGFFPIPLKALADYTSGQILYFRIVFALLALILVIAAFRRQAVTASLQHFKALDPSRRFRVATLTLFGGLLLTSNWLIFIYTINHISVKTASFSYLVCPVITAVLGYVLIREKLYARQWVAVGICALSCALIGMDSAKDLAFSLITATTYALYLITQRKNQGFDRLLILAIQVCFSWIILSLYPSMLLTSVPGEPYFYLLIILVAVMFTVFPLFLNLYALNRINSATIGIMMYLNPLINFTIAFLVYGESATDFQIIGYGLIAVALVIFNFHFFRRLQPA